MMAKFREFIADLFPGSFAMVMATGIVSIACHLLGFEIFSRLLFKVNRIMFIVLLCLYMARSVIYREHIFSDLKNHAKSPTFFTLVAGTNIFGLQYWLLKSDFPAAFCLFFLAIILWLFLSYNFLFTMTTLEAKPELKDGVNGSWFILTVATQSCAVLGAFLATHCGQGKIIIFFFALCMHFLGSFLYFLTAAMIFYRLIFFRVEARTLAPSYWVLMGAAAISTLAGATLLLQASEWEFLVSLEPFLKGFTLLFWSIATWWIPFLVILGIWRHAVQKVMLTYDPQYWSLVFPLGVYTTCSFRVAKVLSLDFLMAIPKYFVYFAMVAWALTFISMITEIAKFVLKGSKAVS